MTSRLQSTINDYRAKLRANEAQAERTLDAAHQHTLAVIQPALDKLYQQMTDAMADGDEIPVSFLYEANRLEAIKQLITGQIDHYGALALMQTGRLQQDGVHLGLDAAMQLLQATVPPGVSWSFGVPSQKAIANLVGATQAGSPLADLFDGFGREAATKVSQALISGVTLGWNPRRIAPQVEQALGISRNRALTISRTESIRAYRASNMETFRKNSDVVSEWVWDSALDERACCACIVMHGTIHPLSEDMGSHPNCFPAGTTVSGPRVVGSTKRLYTGDLIEVETSSGNFLSVTPNHPILTPDGWVNAGDLVEGSYVFSAVDSKRPFNGINPDEYQAPSLIEEVVETFTSPGNMATISVPTTAKDFHGDGTDGEICVIRTYGQLGNWVQPQLLQPLRDLHLYRRHIVRFCLSCKRSFAQFVKRTLSPSNGIMGRLRSFASLLRGHLGRHDVVCLTGSTPFYAHNLQMPADHATRGMQGLCKGFFGLPIDIALRQFLIGYWKLHLSLRGSLLPSLRSPFSALGLNRKSGTLSKVSDRDIALLQPLFDFTLPDMIFSCQGCESFTSLVSVDSSIKPVRKRLGNTLPDSSNSSSVGKNDTFQGPGVGVEDVSELLQSLAGSVQRDQIVRIRKRAFHGHVYNLQTELGWYSANNIITHNCRCTMLPRTKSWDEILSGLDIDASDIEDTRPDIVSGTDWFGDQDEATQRRVLGNAKYEAWSNGDFDLEDIVGRSYDKDWGHSIYEKSLKQLVKG